MPISRVSLPAEPKIRVPFIRRVKPTESFRGIVLAADAFLVYTHWLRNKDKTMPCTALRDDLGHVLDDTGCRYCIEHDPERIRGYLHVWNLSSEREEFLELTEKCWRSARSSMVGPHSFRGFEANARRGNGRKTRLWLTLDAPRPTTNLSKLPAERSPVEALEYTMQL